MARGGLVWGNVVDPAAQRPAFVLAEAIKRGDPGVEEALAGLIVQSIDDNDDLKLLGAIGLLDHFERRHRRPAFMDLVALRRERA